METTTRATAIDRDLTAALVELASRPEPVALGADLDPHRVAETVLAEVLTRAALLAGPPVPVTVQFELLTPGGTHSGSWSRRATGSRCVRASPTRQRC